MDTKSIFKSKTFYFNIITILVTLAAAYGYTPNQNVANQTASALLFASPVVNLILRYITSKSVSIL
jgi:Mg2+/citrate symporter